MSLFYRIAYRIGFTPWEKAATHPPAARQVAALFDREEEERQRPYGKALDLGCGSGFWSAELARRGWQVTGVDIIGRAIEMARKRADTAGAQISFIQADVTALRDAGIGSGFSFIWDLGMLHGLSQEQREAVGQEVSAIAGSGATMLVLAWAPGRRGPLPRGASREDLETALPDWSIIDEVAFDATGLPRPLRKVRPTCYRLLRG